MMSAPAGKLLIGIAPHHDLAIDMIRRFYGTIRESGQRVERVFLFAPDHYRRARRSLATISENWRTEAATIKADREGIKALLATGFAENAPLLFMREHGISIHIAAIAHNFPLAQVVPIVLHWRCSDIALLTLERALLEAYREGDIFVLSMDFSHYRRPDDARREDERTLSSIIARNWKDVRTCDVDAAMACSLLLRIADKLEANDTVILERSDSYQLSGEGMYSCTSYATLFLHRVNTIK